MPTGSNVLQKVQGWYQLKNFKLLNQQNLTSINRLIVNKKLANSTTCYLS